MIVSVAGSGRVERIREGLDIIHGMSPIVAIQIRGNEDDHPAAQWARDHGIPMVDTTAPVDLGIILPASSAEDELWHAGMLLSDVPCIEIHD